ncbi:hypothetical protein K438DRAFT_1873290 [Mycena galopus ATCC 62051]|nr:hypothetical protein K438DRAFT_1873290 [Mycena galopus ATCC 62051]
MQLLLAPLLACLALPSLPVHPALTSRPAPPALPDARAHRICLLRMTALRAAAPKKRSTRSSAARGPGSNSASAASSAGVSKAAADEEKEEEVGQTMRMRRRSGKGEGKGTDADQEVEEVEGGAVEAFVKRGACECCLLFFRLRRGS